LSATSKGKVVVLLQAFTDDSGSDIGDRRLYMAGYLNRADAWELFSKAWRDECRAASPIEYLKMSEAQSLKGQFRGWSNEARDEKLRRLARVILHFQPLSFEFSINRQAFDQVVAPASPRGLKSSHFTSCFAIVSGVSRYIAEQGNDIPVEFIFDRQDGVSDDIGLAFDVMKRSLPSEAQKLIRGKPHFEDDKTFLPLQAADFLAWHLRREHENNVSLELTDLLRADRGHLMIGEIDEAMMKKWAIHHSHQLGTPMLQSKTQWRNLKKEIQRLTEAGIDPSTIQGPGIYYPEGTPMLARVIDRVRRLFRRS
jgi:hypothetical protein